MIRYELLNSKDNTYNFYILSDLIIILDLEKNFVKFFHYIFLNLIKTSSLHLKLINIGNNGIVIT
jgi:hypothetical protein